MKHNKLPSNYRKLYPHYFPNKRLTNTATIAARNIFREQPRRSPRKHPSSKKYDKARGLRVKSKLVWYHRHRKFFFRLSKSGYPVIDPQACIADQLFPNFFTGCTTPRDTIDR